jgi:hypothetical protein
MIWGSLSNVGIAYLALDAYAWNGRHPEDDQRVIGAHLYGE